MRFHKNKPHLTILILSTYAILNSCSDRACKRKDQTIVLKHSQVYNYSDNSGLLIDINKDQIPDFKCVPKRAGNHAMKLIVPIGEDNKLTAATNLLDRGDSINHNTKFTKVFNFNDLDTGAHALISNKYIGVQFKTGNCMHLGWIKFSSFIDGNPNSTAPVYYHNITLSLHQTAYNQGNSLPLIIQ